MAAYLIVEHIITDAAKFEEYSTSRSSSCARKECISDQDMMFTLEGVQPGSRLRR